MLPPILFSSLDVRQTGSVTEVWDPCRKKWVKMTPEEMVRQQLMRHLHHHCGIPFSLMACEKGVKMGDRLRRFDLAVWSRSGSIWMIVECKAPQVTLNEAVLSQVLSYVSKHSTQYLLLSNGHENLMWNFAMPTAPLQEAWPVFP